MCPRAPTEKHQAADQCSHVWCFLRFWAFAGTASHSVFTEVPRQPNEVSQAVRMELQCYPRADGSKASAPSTGSHCLPYREAFPTCWGTIIKALPVSQNLATEQPSKLPASWVWQQQKPGGVSQDTEEGTQQHPLSHSTGAHVLDLRTASLTSACLAAWTHPVQHTGTSLWHRPLSYPVTQAPSLPSHNPPRQCLLQESVLLQDTSLWLDVQSGISAPGLLTLSRVGSQETRKQELTALAAYGHHSGELSNKPGKNKTSVFIARGSMVQPKEQAPREGCWALGHGQAAGQGDAGCGVLALHHTCP